jgi:hypothetical protein
MDFITSARSQFLDRLECRPTAKRTWCFCCKKSQGQFDVVYQNDGKGNFRNFPQDTNTLFGGINSY